MSMNFWGCLSEPKFKRNLD
nr:unnamed protein product [Callosobruchus chinensis]